MKRFKHHNARSIEGSSYTPEQTMNGKAKVNAGGTDLLGRFEGQKSS